MYLMVEFPRVKTNDKEYSIVYYEKVFSFPLIKFEGSCVLCKHPVFEFAVSQDGDDASPVLTSCDIVKVPDPQMGMVKKKKKITHKAGLSHGGFYVDHFQKMTKENSYYFFLSLPQENLVESKHHKLARSLRSGPSDHDLKPNAATRDQLNVRGPTVVKSGHMNWMLEQ